MTKRPNCPQCARQMVFAPDGRGFLCELCGYREVVERDIPPATELSRAQKFLSQGRGDPDLQKLAGIRLTLRQGVAAVKAGDLDEGFSHLERVLLSGDASDDQRARAWLWLSAVYADPDDKRECLEQVLAFDPTHGEARRGLAVLDGRLREEEIINPDQLQVDVPQEPQAAQAEQFICPKCSSRMNYAPDGVTLLCVFCGYEEGAAGETAVVSDFGLGGAEQDFIAGMARAAGHVQPVATRVLQCQGCGVEFVLAPETLSVTCPYCDHVYVTEAAETAEIMPPQAILPFGITADEAKVALREWFRAQKISRVRLSPLVGIYLPVWTFDLSGEIKWRGYVKRGDDWEPASGSGYVMEDDYLVPAQQKRGKFLLKSLQDFDLSLLVEYDARYLADWPAERYTVTMSDASLLARKAIVRDLRRRPYKITSGEDIRDLTFNSSGLTVMSYKLVLLPLWTAHYVLEEQTYDLFINGQNGRVRGEKNEGLVGKFVSWLKDNANIFL